MARTSPGPVKTFSIGFTNKNFNEAEWNGFARITANAVEPNIHEALDFLTLMQEEPFGDSSMVQTTMFPTWRPST